MCRLYIQIWCVFVKIFYILGIDTPKKDWFCLFFWGFSLYLLTGEIEQIDLFGLLSVSNAIRSWDNVFSIYFTQRKKHSFYTKISQLRKCNTFVFLNWLFNHITNAEWLSTNFTRFVKSWALTKTMSKNFNLTIINVYWSKSAFDQFRYKFYEYIQSY